MLKAMPGRDFALLWWGGLFTLTAQASLSVALPAHVYLATGSALSTSLMFLAATLPRLLLSSLAGVLVDRWSRRRTLLVCNLLLAAGCLPLLWVGGAGEGAAAGGLWIVYLVAALQASLTRFVEPAENAMLPTLVRRDQLQRANALNALNNNMARLAGPAAGGAMLAFAGLAGVVAANVLLCLTAWWLIARMRVVERPVGAEGAATAEAAAAPPARTARLRVKPSPLRRLAGEWLDGLRVLWRDRVARLLLIVTAMTSVGEGVFGVLMAPFVIEVLRSGPVELGWIRSAQGVGGIVGGVAIAALGARLAPRAMLAFGSIGLGLIDLAIFNYPRWTLSITPALVLMVLVGLPSAARGTGFATLLQTQVEDRMLGRAYGTLATAASLAMLVGIGLAGSLADGVGIVPVLNIQGYGFTAAGLLSLAVLGISDRNRHRTAAETVHEGPPRT